MRKYLTTILLIIIALTIYTYTDISLNDVKDTFDDLGITGAVTGLTNTLESSLQETIKSTTKKETSATIDTGSIQVTFCPYGDCEQTLVNFINQAGNTLHCAFYDIGLESVQEALLNQHKNPNIEVKVVTDDHYYDKFPYEEFVVKDKSAYMHNKFCITGNKVITGSMNPTDNGANYNDNNLLIFESQELADNFEAEFQELWSGTFKKGDPNSKTIDLSTDKKKVIIESYFCPDDDCANAVEEEIQAAEESIYFMTFSFTHQGIANNILIKHQETKDTKNPIDVKGVFEARQNSKYSKFDVFDYQDIEVYTDANKKTMHHKVFIIDQETVITGSMNPSNNGVDGNDETLLIIHSDDVGAAFTEEFNRIFSEAKAKANE